VHHLVPPDLMDRYKTLSVNKIRRGHVIDIFRYGNSFSKCFEGLCLLFVVLGVKAEVVSVKVSKSDADTFWAQSLQ
jgi:hypothetical protein